MQTGIKSCAKVFSKVKGTAWSLLLFQSTCSCLCPDSATCLCASAILRAPRAPPSLPIPAHLPALPTPAHSPGPHCRPQGPSAPAQWCSSRATPHLPMACPKRSRAHPRARIPAHPQPVRGWGCPGAPLAALLLAEPVAQVLAAGEPLMGQHAALGHCQTLEYPAAFSMGCWVSSNPPLVKLPGLLPVKLRRRPSKLKKKWSTQWKKVSATWKMDQQEEQHGSSAWNIVESPNCSPSSHKSCEGGWRPYVMWFLDWS